MIHEKIILLTAHGSKKEAANSEIKSLAKRLDDKNQYSVIPCFLELAYPSIEEAVESATQKKPEEILLLPYFLTQGRHIQSDIPEIISQLQKKYPKIPIKILDYLGAQKGIEKLLCEIISEIS